MNIAIRKASLMDLDKVVNIETICFPEAEAATRDSFKKRLITFPESFLVAELDGELIGFINGSVIEEKIIRDEYYSDVSFHNPKGDYQSIFGLDVLPQYRGKGIAAILMEELIIVAKKAERKGMTLCCKEEKIPYYKKFGFIAIGKSDSEHGNAVWYDMIILFRRK